MTFLKKATSSHFAGYLFMRLKHISFVYFSAVILGVLFTKMVVVDWLKCVFAKPTVFKFHSSAYTCNR